MTRFEFEPRTGVRGGLVVSQLLRHYRRFTCVYKHRALWNSLAGRVSGEMADARALGARGVIRAGSSPVSPTTVRILRFFLLDMFLHLRWRILRIPLLNERNFVLRVQI
jgi:hypothetical protein